MPLNKQWFIGVDGGGTGTRGVLADREGRILAVARRDSTHVLSRPLSQVMQTLKALCRELLDQVSGTDEEVRSVFLGLAGAGRPREKEQLLQGFNEVYPGRVRVEHDAVAALYAGTWGKPGIVLLAGTGSMAFGVSSQGAPYRVGGWGYLIGDEGSGFSLGQQALTAVMRAFDGRGKPTQLAPLLFAQYKIQEATELVSLLYASSNPRKWMAEAGPLVLQATEQGDEVAQEIVDQATDELVLLAEACGRNMGEAHPIVLAGGLLGKGTLLQRRVAEKLVMLGNAVEIPSFPPLIGSLIMALQLGGVQMDSSVQHNLTESWGLMERVYKHDGKVE
ncbi:N-acetylglucosamine kinase [Ammoniphilus sp. 3BR4]|uniref:N-acetylglucosamine kinase n=1 Tax=Ammoniphilus sp. 3BR4 TaxID=3158265 RepID=UPI003466C71B